MTSFISLVKYTTLSALFLVAFVFNAFVWHNPLFGLVLLLLFLLIYGQTFVGSAALIAFISILGAAAYYLNLLNLPFIASIIILIPLFKYFIIDRFSQKSFSLPNILSLFTFRLSPLSFIIFLLLYLPTTYLLFQNPILEPVRSPWLFIPPVFFVGV